MLKQQFNPLISRVSEIYRLKHNFHPLKLADP